MLKDVYESREKNNIYVKVSTILYINSIIDTPTVFQFVISLKIISHDLFNKSLITQNDIADRYYLMARVLHARIDAHSLATGIHNNTEHTHRSTLGRKTFISPYISIQVLSNNIPTCAIY